ncbi:MAG: DNA polymerase III subunit delta [Candidatus Tectomicrobia bacterium]|uniref:DNA-directed DNA polymerase n=1 Tax=Tectimicrobiota bacterium TaxID=2528274 RepID=A0A932GMU5_UNCTE|nr:DNA polymerase III subunit delta [Candidatus Tectomicrobia bacterium]
MVLRQAQDLDLRGEDFLRRALTPAPPSLTFLALFPTKSLPGGGLWDQLSQTAVTVDCAPLRGTALRRYLKDLFAQEGVSVEEEALQLLVSLVGEELPRLHQEQEKLVLYLGSGGGHVGGELVERMIAGHRMHSVFELTDALGEKNLGRSLTLLHRLLAQGAPPLQVLHLLARQLRLLLEIKALKPKGAPAGQVARVLGVPPYRLEENYAMANRFTAVELARSLLRLQEAEMELKTSDHSPRRVLEGFFLDVHSPGL